MIRYFIFSLSLLVSMSSCDQRTKNFTYIDPSDSRIDFVNEINVRDTLNILDNEFVYNGGGVAIGDLNGDGLQDIYFTANLVGNRLYMNDGNLKFRDVTEISKAQKHPDQWSAGVTMMDLNRDGKLDIYISNTMSPNKVMRENILFINMGNDEYGIPVFENKAKEYGLADTVHDSASAFFDADNDGDLDVFLAVNLIDTQYPNQFITRTTDGTSPNCDRLFINEWSDSLKHPVFKDVSNKAGITRDGYSHSVIINDFNKDGWQDIYVCNDYLSNDILYINNQDGTFSDNIGNVFKHESLSSMGSDIADINNDGLEDLFITEMLPIENKRKKLFLNANNYTTYLFTEQYNYEYQYVRNTLQLNRGKNPDKPLPVFSDVAFFADVQETDWSWSSLMADFDNDSYRDIMVTNGFPRDITDHDFGAFRSSNASTLISKAALYNMIPEVKVPNVAFKNNGDLTFSNATTEWGMDIPSFSNGSAYADLDNDGDLDFVVNNINDRAFLYRNNSGSVKEGKNFIRIQLAGPITNPDAFGSEVQIYYQEKKQIAKMISGRGYLSQSENIAHFGLGNHSSVDSLIVIWPDGRITVITNPEINHQIKINHESSRDVVNENKSDEKLLVSVDEKIYGIDFFPQENDFIDFNFQRTLPHKFSQYGPGVAVGDINGDGLDDIVFGGSSRFDETIYVQSKEGKFKMINESFKPNYNKKEEDLGLLLFDADGDNDNDLYIARGSYQHEKGSVYYQHLLCVNDGKGRFNIDTLAIGNLKTCGGSVKAADYDQDGDLDLFIGGRVLPRAYPLPDRSFLLRNDSREKDKPVFADVTEKMLPELSQIGMVSDALWTDFDNDGLTDLLLANEWSSLTFIKNNGSKFTNITDQSGISDKLGWWNSLSGADFDNDGDTDYIAGNFGNNIFFKCSAEEPIRIYSKDFDSNGLYDPFISCYWMDSTGSKNEYFYHTRDDMIKQLVMIRGKFENYAKFGAATVQKVFTAEELRDAKIMNANWMSSSYVENLGNGKFKISKLPMEAQLAPVYGTMPYDLNEDGWLDILLVGNDYGMELLQGRADAFYGLALMNEEGKGFRSLTIDESNFFVPKDARGLTRISIKGKGDVIMATQNRDSLRMFMIEKQGEIIRLNPNEHKVKILYDNGKEEIRELYWGSTFMSQQSRSLKRIPVMKQLIFMDSRGAITRTVQ